MVPEALAHQTRCLFHPGEISIVLVRLFVQGCMPPRVSSFLQQRRWWPTMSADTSEFISARSKFSHHIPAGFLHPSQIPYSPWSKAAVDFVTGLPTSEGITRILTIVDRFSKSVHFVPLPKLPSPLETANLLVAHVFRLYSIP